MFEPSKIHRAGRTLLLALICAGQSACSSNGPITAISEDFLLGTWQVDLRPTPDSDPYYKEFIVTGVRGGSFSGTFYDTPISEGRINNDWGKLRIAFVTADGSGSYYHSATLEREVLEGLSNSTGRGFLAYWTAVKK